MGKSIFRYALGYMLFCICISCGNDLQEVNDFLAEKNLPIGVADNVHLLHTEGGELKNSMTAATVKDYSNRKEHPYQEFPNGIKIVTYDALGDSVTLTANYAKSYAKTGISEINGNVVIINHKDRSSLFTEQLFWDQNTHYIYTEKKFKLIQQNKQYENTINGKGFESNEDLTKANFRDIDGPIYIIETEENKEL